MARQLDDKVLVEGQISPDRLKDYAAQGVTLVINNRPDHEEQDQPTSADMEQAAAAAGLQYRHVPIVRGIGPSDVEQMREAINAAGQGKALLFCRSGTRSTLCWALARKSEGVPRAQIEQRAADAGYSLDAIAHLL